MEAWIKLNAYPTTGVATIIGIYNGGVQGQYIFGINPDGTLVTENLSKTTN